MAIWNTRNYVKHKKPNEIIFPSKRLKDRTIYEEYRFLSALKEDKKKVIPYFNHLTIAYDFKKDRNVFIKNQLFTFKGHESWVNAVAVTEDGKLAISGGRETTLKVWNLQSRKEVF